MCSVATQSHARRVDGESSTDARNGGWPTGNGKGNGEGNEVGNHTLEIDVSNSTSAFDMPAV